MAIEEKLITIAENQQKVYNAGYEKGKTDGSKNEYDTFWDNYQNNGTRQDYQYAFSFSGWNNTTFKPKYALTNITNASSMFARSTIKTIDMPIDLTNCTNCSFMFNNALVLNTIKELILGNNTANSNSMFASCGALVNLTISGTIPFDFDLRRAKRLSKASIQSIYDALSETITGKTLTLNKTAVDQAFETSPGAKDGSTSAEWIALTDRENQENPKRQWQFTLLDL